MRLKTNRRSLDAHGLFPHYFYRFDNAFYDSTEQLDSEKHQQF